MGIRVDEFDLTRHELAVATMAVVPSSIEVSLKLAILFRSDLVNVTQLLLKAQYHSVPYNDCLSQISTSIWFQSD